MPRRRARNPSAPRPWPWRLLLIAALVVLPMPVRAIEEPAYRVVRGLGEIELREYAAYSVAEVTVPGPAEDAGGQAFPILAGYIFGKNKDEQRFAMTAPVTQSALPATLETAGPVAQSRAPGGFVVRFVLPKGVTAASAPEPLDARIRLRDLPATEVAVIRYSGFWTDANYDEHLAKLEAALRAADLAWTGEAVYSRYDAPFMPWFLRRNEIWLPIDQRP